MIHDSDDDLDILQAIRKIAAMLMPCFLCLGSYKVVRMEESCEVVDSRQNLLASFLFTKIKRLMNEFVSKIYACRICINDIGLHISMPILLFWELERVEWVHTMGRFRSKLLATRGRF